MMNSTRVVGSHPYYPVGAEITGYLANTTSVPVLIATFFTGVAVILGISYSLISRRQPTLSRNDTSAALWFTVCGFIHLFFEGYFAYNSLDMGGRSDLFGQLWKEYSLSDSRYLTRDSFVVCMETVTAVFWGPLSFFCAYAIATDHPMRHPVQMVVSLGQLYGDVLYYATCQFERAVPGAIHCRPEHVYFWAYYVLMNSFWIVIPATLLVQSMRRTGAIFAKVQESERGAGRAKKGL